MLIDRGVDGTIITVDSLGEFREFIPGSTVTLRHPAPMPPQSMESDPFLDIVRSYFGIEDGDRDILAISSNGYGKRSMLDDYRVQTRGGKGIITMKATTRTGSLVAIKGVLETDDLMISTVNGIMIRMHVADISTMGRITQGVRLIRIGGDDKLVAVEKLNADVDGEQTEDSPGSE